MRAQVHLRTLIIGYLVFLPLQLIQEGMAIWKIHVATFMVGFALIGLDDVGNGLEDPFGEDLADIPLNTLAKMDEDGAVIRPYPLYFIRSSTTNPYMY